MKSAIQIRVPVLQLFIWIWDMKHSLNVKILVQKWKFPPNTSSSWKTKGSNCWRLDSQQRLSYLWKLSQNPFSQQVRLLNSFPFPIARITLYFLLVADVGGFLGMILGFSLLDLEVVIRLLLSKLQDRKRR